MKILITGGAGFVGHHFVEHFLKNTDAEIVVLDKLNYSGSYERLRDIDAFDSKRVFCLASDFNTLGENVISEIGDCSHIFHIGAESHVDNSISNPYPFIESNVRGTQAVLDVARRMKGLECFFYFSTDEVFGPAPEGVRYAEGDEHNPSNPYAASKSGGEMLVKSAGNTYGVPFIITRTMNIFGERQHPEKFIPLCISSARDGRKITIHANKEKTKAGSRFYIHARNVADAYLHLLEHGSLGESYHIVGEQEVDNLELATLIADIQDKDLHYEMLDFHSSRPGHDLRYALCGEKMKSIGWEPPKSFRESLERTVEWSLAHPNWL